VVTWTQEAGEMREDVVLRVWHPQRIYIAFSETHINTAKVISVLERLPIAPRSWTHISQVVDDLLSKSKTTLLIIAVLGYPKTDSVLLNHSAKYGTIMLMCVIMGMHIDSANVLIHIVRTKFLPSFYGSTWCVLITGCYQNLVEASAVKL
jgi:hypothetical protein